MFLQFATKIQGVQKNILVNLVIVLEVQKLFNIKICRFLSYFENSIKKNHLLSWLNIFLYLAKD